MPESDEAGKLASLNAWMQRNLNVWLGDVLLFIEKV
jgi:hypothetical protein